MATAQRSSRPGLDELDVAALSLGGSFVIPASSDEAEIWAAAERYRRSIPAGIRSRLGIFYTPPAIANALLDDLVRVGGARFDGSERVFDPACGGGAFLVPVARRIAPQIRRGGGTVDDLANCLIGRDIDQRGLEFTRAGLDLIAAEVFGRTTRWNLDQANSLSAAIEGTLPRSDLVVGNPPFGRVKLSSAQRCWFGRGLSGHANLYGLFLDLALRVTDGPVGFVMPTSWLAGDYFRGLRAVVDRERPLRSIRFMSSRSTVFSGVTQEMCLAAFTPGGRSASVLVYRDMADQGHGFTLRDDGPWVLPRDEADEELLTSAVGQSRRLQDYGYDVHTGPLVWNRHRDRLRIERTSGTCPIIWSDAVAPGRLVDYRTSARRDRHLETAGLEHMVLNAPALLVKRTTSIEQPRRLLGAISRTGGVVVENHLNMVVASNGLPAIPLEALARLLSTATVDRVFRAISGTVAVSASELRALPLPAPDRLAGLMEADDPDEMVHRAYMDDEDG